MISTNTPIGTPVTYTDDVGAHLKTTTRSVPWQLGDGSWVVSLDGRSGGHALSRCELREPVEIQRQPSTSEPDAPASAPDTSGAFADIVRDALAAAVTPERVQALVAKRIDSIVTEAITDALRAYSDTGKLIREAVASALAVNDLDLPSYGQIVTDMLKREIDARCADLVGAKLREDMAELLNLAPKRVKLSELVASLLDEKGDDDCCDYPSVWMEVERSEYGWISVYLHDSKPHSKYDASIQFSIHPSRNDDDKNAEGSISMGKVKGTKLGETVHFGRVDAVKMGRWFGLEQRVLAMYAASTIIEIDEWDCETSRGDY